ncbi:Outer mitochondrial membrane receptor Tom20 [Intoshia linei]|uniref:Outer mitochondrial membrane receptor Tom20 n=1 Tax=Intoshia linei TaxID=1819745 RepID=A0A177BDB5_9BILA|nr:Outer mitochondrial membrane receptor Tom20 [Intoshia linei]
MLFQVYTKLPLIAASVGVAFASYCVYFDYKRRSHPNFWNILKEKRNAKKTEKIKKRIQNAKNGGQEQMMQKMQHSDELLQNGLIEEGVEEISEAILMNPQPLNFMMVLKDNMPKELFIKIYSCVSDAVDYQKSLIKEQVTLTPIEDEME